MSVYGDLEDATRKMEEAVYAALDAIDAYAAVVQHHLSELEEEGGPNPKLAARLTQFAAKAAAMTGAIEDDVLTPLTFCLDRLFSVAAAERGEFI